jgi:hypothetical protein
MKTSLCTMIGVLLPLAAHADTPPMRDAATPEQLNQAYRQAEQADPMRQMKQVKGPDPSKADQPQDLLKSSDILCFGDLATLVPKQAILHLPPNLADRLKFHQGAKIVSWSDFYAVNRGWIDTVEVERPQAEGNVALAAEVAKRIPKSANLVVATFKGGPISVLPLKKPAQPTKADKPAKTESSESSESSESNKSTTP